MKPMQLSDKSIERIYWALSEGRGELQAFLQDRGLLTVGAKLKKSRKHYSDWENESLMEFSDLVRLEKKFLKLYESNL